MLDARRFTDAQGFSWQVCELWSAASNAADSATFADVAPARGWGWLYFFSRGTTLVLRDYPVGWQELTWGELEQLRLRARVLWSDTTIRVASAHASRDAMAPASR